MQIQAAGLQVSKVELDADTAVSLGAWRVLDQLPQPRKLNPPRSASSDS